MGIVPVAAHIVAALTVEVAPGTDIAAHLLDRLLAGAKGPDILAGRVDMVVLVVVDNTAAVIADLS